MLGYMFLNSIIFDHNATMVQILGINVVFKFHYFVQT